MISVFRRLMAVFVFLAFSINLSAATISGTVIGPDGPVPNARVIAHACSGAPEEYPTDGSGAFSIDFPDGAIDCLEAAPPPGQSGWIGERLNWVDASEDREIRLILTREVTISGRFLLPDGVEVDVDVIGQRLDKYASPCFPEYFEGNAFRATCPAGVYVFVANERCQSLRIDGQDRYLCDLKDYYGSVTVDARQSPVGELEIEVQRNSSRSLADDRAPIAELITVGEADEGGIAMVSGAAGAVPGATGIGIVNLYTGHVTQGGSRADGSFDIPMLAPPGSWLEVRHDSRAIFGALNAPVGTILQVSPGGGANAFGVLSRASVWGQSVQGDDIESLGLRDAGQVWIGGELDSRTWQRGADIELEGPLRIYSRNAANLDPGELNGTGEILLERVIDPQGKQELPNPVFVSHNLTPTGQPIETAGSHGSNDGIFVGELDICCLEAGGPNHLAGNWSASVSVPDDLPDGVYSLVFKPNIENVEREDLHFEHVFTQIFDTPLTRGHATLIRIGAPDSARLSWALGMNEFSNGSRGTIALEDRDRMGIAGRITNNSKPLVLPMRDARHGKLHTYRMEPFVPLLGASNRGWLPPPTIPLAFPSGNLTVRVEQPDGSMRNIGQAPFQQFYVHTPVTSTGRFISSVSNGPQQYYTLSTNNPRFEISFQQYGLHRITMQGLVKDVWGANYRGGGTYEVWVAKPLDLETGVFAGTPFEVGDAFSSAVVVQPGVAAEVEVHITHFPESDPARRIDHRFTGKANRFGKFHAGTGEAFVFEEPGEYRVDVVARYWDEDGVLWMGAESWASIVETPGSDLITHGIRNSAFCGEELQQWVVVKDSDVCGTHLPFPYHTGDIAWSLDTPFDPYFTAMFPGVSVQDTGGDFQGLFRQRAEARRIYGIENQIATGEMRLFSSHPNGYPASFAPDDPATHRGYAYSSAARPGVRIRDMVTEFQNEESYWRFDDTYNLQAGNGLNGDLPNDFKFQFGGAVYRAPDRDFFYYGAYGSLWVLLPNDDPEGTRVMPPFQGNGGGPTGGPIMTLHGREIDMFIHPTGIRPGTILEVGDTISFSGQVAPTLASEVSVEVRSPSGVRHVIEGAANKVGYFYQPARDFVADEPGVWTARAETRFTGRTSAGQVSTPFPSGGVLGVDGDVFEFYVVAPESAPLDLDLPEQSWVEPGKSPVPVGIRSVPGWSNTELHFSTVMPGFLLESGASGALNYRYDATALHEDFPNLDVVDDEVKWGVDTVTMSFLVSATDENGDSVFRARQVLLQGEELLVPDQKPTSGPGSFFINAGLSDAWYQPETSGQGFFIIVYEELESIFLSWFTYDSEPSGGQAQLGDADHRWLTAFGTYEGNRAVMEVVSTSNGQFDTGTEVQRDTIGTITLTFDDCDTATIDYDLTSIGRQGSIPLRRIVADLGDFCRERLTGSPMTDRPQDGADFEINVGVNDAWYQPETSGQGFFFINFPTIERLFVGWFTHETEISDDGSAVLGDSGHRWVTALGPTAGNSATLDVSVTSGGVFDDPTDVQSTEPGAYGTVTVEFEDCSNATVRYDLPTPGLSGEIPVRRIVQGNAAICESLQAGAAQ